MKVYDVIIIGGGASGMAAAVMAVRQGLSVAIAERQARVGKKLLSTGSGTCNLSNLNIRPENFHSAGGDAESFVAPAFSRFSTHEIREFFRSIGVETEADGRNRVYPVCRSAAAVLDCLRLSYLNRADEITEFDVASVEKKNNVFCVKSTDGRELFSKNVIVAAGGAASPGLGGREKTHLILDRFKVTAEKQFPCVTSLKTDTAFTRAMKGLRVNAKVVLKHKGKRVADCTDELLFTENGLSGPAAFFISREASRLCEAKEKDVTAEIDFLCGKDALQLISERRKLPREASELLTGLFQKRVGQTLLRYSRADVANRTASSLTDSEIKSIARAVSRFEVKVYGTNGMKDAQVTAGGVKLNEIDPYTMELKKQKGVYCIGEMLDIDGDCGGYNLSWAWSSAFIAVESIKEKSR